MINYSLTQDRLDIIKNFAFGRDTLDIGCVDARPDGSKKYQTTGLHIFLQKHTKCLTGLDIDREGVEMLRGEGYNVVYGNAETVNLGKNFECIIAGEVIEHLSNFGLFLDNMKQHLSNGSHLVLTTPNAFSISNIWRIVCRNRIRVHGDHTCWFDLLTLSQLLKRHGFDVIELHMANNSKWHQRKHIFKLTYKIFRFITCVRSYFSATIIVVARKNIT